MVKAAASKLIARRLRTKMEQLLAKHNFSVICVTGSVGKTSAKYAIAKVLSTKYRTYVSDESYNWDIGLPLSLFGLKAPDRLASVAAWQKIFRQINKLIRNYPYEVVVLEIAEDEQQTMQEYVDLLKPDFFVVTGATAVHMARMHSVKNIERDIIELASSAKRVIYNADFPVFSKAFGKQKHNLSYGIAKGQAHFGQLKRSREGLLKGELILGHNRKLLITQQVMQAGLYSLLAASLIAHEYDIEVSPLVETLSQLQPLRGRGRLLAGINDAKLIDDSYNSSPEATVAALNTLNEFKGRKIAVLGSMNELGSYSSTAHAQVGEVAARTVDMLVTIGADAERYLVSAAQTVGMSASNIKRFDSPYVAGHFLKKTLRAGDVVLIKGSQDRVFSEEVTRIVLAKHLDPAQELVRQTSFWQRKKKRAFPNESY